MDLENGAAPPDTEPIPYFGNAAASLTMPWLALSCTGGDVGSPKYCSVSIETPGGTISGGSAGPLYDWGQLHAEGQWSGNVSATMQLRWEDPRHPFPEGVTTIDTPHHRPNHLRQVHGRYVCAWNGNITWSAQISGWYTPYDGTEPGSTVNIATSDSGIDASGDGAISDSDPPGLAYSYSWDNGIGGPFLPPPQTAIATIAGTYSIDTIPVEGHLDQFNYTGPVYPNTGYNVPLTSALDNTVTGYWPATPTSGEYVIWPSWVGQQTGTAEVYDGSSDVGLPGYPSLVVFGGDVRERSTPHDSGTVTYNNAIGPNPYNHADSVYTAPPTETYTIAYPLNPYKRRSRQDYYGRWESLWVTLPEDTSWMAFKLDRVPTLLVDTCMSTRSGTTVNLGPVSAFDWTAGTGVTMSVSGGYRRAVVSGSPSDPALRRNLWDDWQDMAVNPSAYRDAASTPADITTYITNRKAWYQIRKRINTDADICNWGNHRWLKIVGKADASRTFTLRLLSANAAISDNYRLGMLSTDTGAPDPETDPSVRVIEVTQTAAQGDVTGLTLGTTDTTVYVDLAELAEQMGSSLAHVTGFEFRDLEAGGTYDFKTVSLASGTANGVHSVDEGTPVWGYWTAIPYADDECVIPVCDGRVCCLADDINEGTESPYVLTWIDRYSPVTTPVYSPRDGDETKTMDALREDIANQEGFIVDAYDFPAKNEFTSYDWAIWLDTGWHDADDSYSARASIKCADVIVPALVRDTWECEGLFRGQARGITLDASDKWPEDNVTVEARALDDADEAHGIGTAGTSDMSGAVTVSRLPQTRNGVKETLIDQNKGTMGNPDYWPDDLPHLPLYHQITYTATNLLDGSGDPITDTGNIANLSIDRPVFAGEKDTPSAGGVSLWASENGWMYRAYASGTTVTLERRSLDGGDWQTVGTKTGAYPCVGGGASGSVEVVYTASGAVRLWDAQEDTDVSVATGSRPFVRWAANGSLQVISYWAGGKLYALVRDPLGQTLHGGAVEVVTAPEQSAAIDWRKDGTMEIIYSDGSAVQMLTSGDDGGTWA